MKALRITRHGPVSALEVIETLNPAERVPRTQAPRGVYARCGEARRNNRPRARMTAGNGLISVADERHAVCEGLRPNIAGVELLAATAAGSGA